MIRSFIRLLFCLIVISVPLSAQAAPRFTMTGPPGWKMVEGQSEKELVRTFKAPASTAFIEVYARKMEFPGLRTFARDWTRSGVHGGLLFTKLEVTDQGFHNGVERLARTYTGMYQGQKTESALHVYYYEGHIFLIQAVYPASRSATFEPTVTTSLDTFRLEGAEYYTDSASGSGCDRVLGQWRWFTGKLVTLLPGGRIKDSHISTWECVDEAAGQYVFSWVNGQYVDTLYLDLSGNRLEGSNNQSQTVTAERVGQDGSPYAGQTSQGNTTYNGASDRIVGAWKWFTGVTVTVLADGKIQGSPDSSWRLLDRSSRTYRFSWSNGKYTDTVQLDASGNRLEGSNQQGSRVSAERVDGQYTPGRQPAQQNTGSSGNRAWKVSGNTMAQWGVARGTVSSTATPSVWELETGRAVGLHFRNQSGHAYSVEIREKQSGQLTTAMDVSSFAKVRVGPGHFVVTVRSGTGSASWTCDWE